MVAPVEDDGADAWRRSVVRTYDEEPLAYVASRRMQDSNLRMLGAHLSEKITMSRANRVLDVGCGDAQSTQIILEEAGVAADAMYGLDPSLELLRYGQGTGVLPTVVCGDARRLPFRPEVFDLVVSNSALHWLNVPELGLTPLEAFREIWSSLRPGGYFGASIAAEGTAREIAFSYHRIATAYERAGVALSPGYREDPVGGMKLPDLVRSVESVGLVVLRAEIQYEPVQYGSAEEYLEDVRAYGFGAFTAAFPEGEAEEAFDRIKRDFVDRSPLGQFVHRQFMLYVVAERPKPQ